MIKPSPGLTLPNPLSIFFRILCQYRSTAGPSRHPCFRKQPPKQPSDCKRQGTRDALDLLNTAAGRITNNVPTVQTIDQIIGAVSDQLQAQQLHVQREIQEQTKATNAPFVALAEQMQQLISTTTTPTNARNPPTPRLPPVSTRFHSEETRDIYIPNETLPPSTDTLYNNEFSRTARRDEELHRSVLQRRQPPAANHFGFSDYPPEDYYDHPQPRDDMMHTPHCEEDSSIKMIVDNMHPLVIDGATTNKRLLRFFICLENEFG
uniref:Uncharacterized protein n=1 Tax=Romanomermis culicivorax TaxID=13658 RepID=A0A915JCU7_ROMCU